MYKVQQHRIEGGGADWAPYDPDSRVLAEAQGRTMAEALRKNGVGLEELPLRVPQRSIVEVLAADGGGDSLARQSKAATFKRRRRFLVSTGRDLVAVPSDRAGLVLAGHADLPG